MLAWLEENAALEAMRAWPWAYPLTEIAHLLGLALLVGAAALFDVRLLGLAQDIPVTTAARLLPLARFGFALAALSGVLLFLHAPSDLIANVPFLLKLALIGVAGLNVLVFHLVTTRHVTHWNANAPTPRAAKLAALVSLSVWVSVVALGRLIAYL